MWIAERTMEGFRAMLGSMLKTCRDKEKAGKQNRRLSRDALLQIQLEVSGNHQHPGSVRAELSSRTCETS